MLKKDAIEYFGGVKKMADALGVWPQAIYQYPDVLSDSIACKIEVITNGGIKVNDNPKPIKQA